MNIPFYEEIRALCKEGGFKAYFVGGCVRDVILGRDVSDVDLVCLSHDYKDFASAVRILLPAAWVEFKDNVRLVCPGLDIDISKPRGNTIEEDLLMRDFTINNLAMDMDGNIIGDDTDVKNRVIRQVSDHAFTDDPLRLLRTFRFASQLGFRVEENTLRTVESLKHLIKQSASERILAEMNKLAEGEQAAHALILMQESGLYEIIMGGIPLVCSVIEAAKRRKGLLFILAAMIYNDENAGILVRKLNLSNAASRRVTRIADAVRLLKAVAEKYERFSVRRLIFAYPEEIQDALEIFSTSESCDGKELWDIETFVHNVMIEMKYVDFDLPMRLNGGFLMNMGISAGRVMGAVIAEVRPLLASGELKDLDAAEQFIREKYMAE